LRPAAGRRPRQDDRPRGRFSGGAGPGGERHPLVADVRRGRAPGPPDHGVPERRRPPRSAGRRPPVHQRRGHDPLLGDAPRRPGDDKAPWPPWEKTPRITNVTAPPVVAATPPTTTATAPKAAATPRTANGTQSAAPATQAPVRAPSQTLPRTGAGIIVLLAIAA